MGTHPYPKRGGAPPNFRLTSIVAKRLHGLIYATRYGGRLWPTHNHGYTTPHSAPLTLLSLLATSASSLMNILPFLAKFQPSPKLATTISDSFVVSVLTLIPPQRAPLPPPSFTPNLITVILSTTTYRSLRLGPTRLQLIQNSLARAVVKAPKSCHITPVLSSLHWLKITERIECKLRSLT